MFNRKKKHSEKQKPKIKNSSAPIQNSNAYKNALAQRNAAGVFSTRGITVTSHELIMRIVNLLYAETWEAQKVIDIPVDDMLRSGWTYSCNDEKTSQLLLNAQEELHSLNKFERALKIERLEGGSALLLGISDGLDPSEPLDLNLVGKGDLRFVHVLSRQDIAIVSFETNPFSPNYGDPHFYQVRGRRVHKSRLIVFDGNPLFTRGSTDTYDMQDGFGVPVLRRIARDIYRSADTRDAASELVRKTGAFFIMTDLINQLSSNEGEANIKMIEEILCQLSAYDSAVINSDSQNPTQLQTISPNFAAVPELIESTMRIVAIAADIPLSRYLSDFSGGLGNNNGENESYYGMLETRRELRLKPKIKQYLEVLGRSVFGSDFDSSNVEVEFDPLWTESAQQKAATNSTNIASILSLVQSGVLSDEEGVKELVDLGALSPDLLENERPSSVMSDDIDVSEARQQLADTINDNPKSY